MGSPGPSQMRVYRVSELQAAVRGFLEEEFGRVWVEGELSGVKRPHSGHVYFTLKDEKARLDVVLWRSSAVRLKFNPEDGLVVRARGRSRWRSSRCGSASRRRGSSIRVTRRACRRSPAASRS